MKENKIENLMNLSDEEIMKTDFKEVTSKTKFLLQGVRSNAKLIMGLILTPKDQEDLIKKANSIKF